MVKHDNLNLEPQPELINNEQVKAEETDVEPEEEVYPPTKVVIPAMLALALAFFVIALDRTILGTAIPSITNEFKSFDDIAWYEAAFLLPFCALQLSFGRVYTFYSVKWSQRPFRTSVLRNLLTLIAVLVALIVVFEIGSIISATAKTSHALIVGRMISGCGAAGMTGGVLLTVNTLVPLKSRPKYLGSFGACFGLASILGPLLGGVLTAVSWRYVFVINVPVGAIALVVLIPLIPNSAAPVKPAETLLGKINQLDPLGFLTIASCTICLLFALQWGNVKYPWCSGIIIALFVLSGVFGLAFIAVQIWRKEHATVPSKILFQRTVFSACVAYFGIGSLLVVFAYYLPIWFQAIQGKSPQSSGIALIALLLSNVVFVIGGGIFTNRVGYYTPVLICGSLVAIVGAAMVSTWQVYADRGQWIGYQVLLGAGLGLILQGPNIAVQTVLPKHEIPIGLSLIGFVQFFSSTIIVTVCQSLLQNRLIHGLSGKIPDFDPKSISCQGATSIRTLVAPEYLPVVLEAYNEALRAVWFVGLGLASLTFVASLGFEWRSVKGEKKKGDAESEGEDREKKQEGKGS